MNWTRLVVDTIPRDGCLVYAIIMQVVNLSFNYTDSYPSVGPQRRGNKRGSSATQQMLAERATQLDTEQESSGQPPVWNEVYALMQCPSPPCNSGPYCWHDPFGKHYKLPMHHLKALVNYVEQGNTLQSHDDVPEHVREQLLAEEQERLERQPQQPASCPTPFPPINITNVLPSYTCRNLGGRHCVRWLSDV
jgi:hypothetical protein